MKKQGRAYYYTRFQQVHTKRAPVSTLPTEDLSATTTPNSEPESVRDIMRSWLPRGPYQFLLMLLALIGAVVTLYRGDMYTFLAILGIVAAGCGIPTVSDLLARHSNANKQPDA